MLISDRFVLVVFATRTESQCFSFFLSFFLSFRLSVCLSVSLSFSFVSACDLVCVSPRCDPLQLTRR